MTFDYILMLSSIAINFCTEFVYLVNVSWSLSFLLVPVIYKFSAFNLGPVLN